MRDRVTESSLGRKARAVVGVGRGPATAAINEDCGEVSARGGWGQGTELYRPPISLRDVEGEGQKEGTSARRNEAAKDMAAPGYASKQISLWDPSSQGPQPRCDLPLTRLSSSSSCPSRDAICDIRDASPPFSPPRTWGSHWTSLQGTVNRLVTGLQRCSRWARMSSCPVVSPASSWADARN